MPRRPGALYEGRPTVTVTNMRLLGWLGLLAICVAITAGLGFYKYRQIQAAIAFGASFPETVEAVEVVTVTTDRHQETTRVSADVVAVRSVELRTELDGRVVEVGFEPGAVVAADRLLLALDTSEEAAQLAAARAEQEIARLALERAGKLLATGAGTTEARDAARARFDAARAVTDRAAAVVAKKVVRAPFDGRTSLTRFEVGQFVGASTLVTRLVDTTGDVWLDFPLPQRNADLALGTRITWEADGASGSAVIEARDSSVDAASRNVRFRARTENRDGRLVQGMNVTVAVPVGPERSVALVPSVAIRRDSFGASAYVLRPAEEGAIAPERAERRALRTGPERDGRTVVFSGLEPGERVAATGAFKLRDGVLVAAAAPGSRPADRARSEATEAEDRR